MMDLFMKEKMEPVFINGIKKSVDSKQVECTEQQASTKLASHCTHIKFDIPFDSEVKLIEDITLMVHRGFDLTKKELVDIVKSYIILHKSQPTSIGEYLLRHCKFENNTPSSEWLNSFIKKLKIQIKDQRNIVKGESTPDPEVVYSFYDLLQNEVKMLGIENKSKHVWNLYETSLLMYPLQQQLIETLGVLGTEKRSTLTSYTNNTSIVACVSANGHKLPPYVISKGSNFNPSFSTTEWEYPKSLHAISKEGFMTAEIFSVWFKKFCSVVAERPLLLIFDGHASHLDYEVVNLAHHQNISIIKLPPCSTASMQPLDTCVFKTLCSKWSEAVLKLTKNSFGQQLKKNTFTDLLGPVWNECVSEADIKEGFEKAGIYPCNRLKFPIAKFSKFLFDKYNTEPVHNDHQSSVQSSLVYISGSLDHKNLSYASISTPQKERAINVARTSQEVFFSTIGSVSSDVSAKAAKQIICLTKVSAINSVESNLINCYTPSQVNTNVPVSFNNAKEISPEDFPRNGKLMVCSNNLLTSSKALETDLGSKDVGIKETATDSSMKDLKQNCIIAATIPDIKSDKKCKMMKRIKCIVNNAKIQDRCTNCANCLFNDKMRGSLDVTKDCLVKICMQTKLNVVLERLKLSDAIWRNISDTVTVPDLYVKNDPIETVKASIAARKPAVKQYFSKMKRKRLKCGVCENCTANDCLKCTHCKDRFSNIHVKKQICAQKKCKNLLLSSKVFCDICGSEDSKSVNCYSDLMECSECYRISHASCIKEQCNGKEGKVLSTMVNYWICPECITEKYIPTNVTLGGVEDLNIVPHVNAPEAFVVSGKPFLFPIMNGLKLSSTIHVSGILSSNATSFVLQLQTGDCGFPVDDIGLCIYSRLQDCIFGMNAFDKCSGWGEEQAVQTTLLENNKPFQISIICYMFFLKIEINLKHVSEFYHRIAPSALRYLNVKSSSSDVIINEVWIEDSNMLQDSHTSPISKEAHLSTFSTLGASDSNASRYQLHDHPQVTMDMSIPLAASQQGVNYQCVPLLEKLATSEFQMLRKSKMESPVIDVVVEKSSGGLVLENTGICLTMANPSIGLTIKRPLVGSTRNNSARYLSIEKSNIHLLLEKPSMSLPMEESTTGLTVEEPVVGLIAGHNIKIEKDTCENDDIDQIPLENIDIKEEPLEHVSEGVSPTYVFDDDHCDQASNDVSSYSTDLSYSHMLGNFLPSEEVLNSPNISKCNTGVIGKKFRAIHIKGSKRKNSRSYQRKAPLKRRKLQPEIDSNITSASLDSKTINLEQAMNHCSHCEYSTTNKTNFINHLLIHSDERKYISPYCSYKGKQSVAFRAHLKVHSTERPFKCEYCPFSFKRQDHLFRHWKLHADLKPFRCSKCSFRASSRQDLKSHFAICSAHAKILHKDLKALDLLLTNDQELICKGDTFHHGFVQKEVVMQKDNFLHENHASVTGSNDGNKISQMTKSSKSFPAKISVSFTNYIKNAMKANLHSNVFHCPDCSFKTSAKGNFRNHLFIHSEQRLFSCPFCSYKGKQSAGLRAHLKIHKPGKPHRCTLCPYKSVRKQNLVQHMRIHSDIKPFKCKTCSYRSTTKQAVEKHRCKNVYLSLPSIISDELGVMEETNQCDTAELKEVVHSKINLTNTESQNQSRKRINSKYVIQSQLNGPIFCCTKCDFVCKRKCALANHIKSHTRKVYESCFQCKFRPSSYSAFCKHLNIHSISGEVSCPFCDFKTKDFDMFISHAKIHSSEKTKLESNDSTSLSQTEKTEVINKIEVNEMIDQELQEYETNVIESNQCSLNKIMIPTGSKIKTNQKIGIRKGRNGKIGIRKGHKGKIGIRKGLNGQVYYCMKCNFSSKRRCAIGNHIKSHNMRLECSINLCKFKCASYNSLGKHVRGHSYSGELCCTYCDVKTHEMDEFISHIKSHDGKPIYKCANVCSFHSSVKEDLINHSVLCINIFSENFGYKTNVSIASSENSDLQANMSVFSSDTSFETVNTDENDEPISSKLSDSQASGSNSSSEAAEDPLADLEIVDSHNLDERENYSNLKDAEELEQNEEHIPCKNVPIINYSRFSCPKCDFKSTKKAAMGNHVKSHQGFWYNCPLCPLSSKLVSWLKRHLLAAHSNSKFLKCKMCEFVANKSDMYISHLEIHRILENPLTENVFCCPSKFCSYYTTTKQALEKHTIRCRHIGVTTDKVPIRTNSSISSPDKSNLEENDVKIFASDEQMSSKGDNKISSNELTVFKSNLNDDGEFSNLLNKSKDLDGVNGKSPNEFLEPYRLKYSGSMSTSICGNEKMLFSKEKGNKNNLRKVIDKEPVEALKLELHSNPSSAPLNNDVQANTQGFNCMICDYHTEHKSNFKNHVLIHSEERQFSCPYCPYKAKQSPGLWAHLKRHISWNTSINGNEKKVISKEKGNKNNLRKVIDKEPVEALKLELNSNLSSALLNTDVQANTQGFNCMICDYHTENKSAYKNHVLIHSEERQFSCPYCPYKAKQNPGLRAHLKKHMAAKPFHCQYCSYKCKRKQNLIQHIQIHSKNKPYKCKLCSYRTTAKQYLKKHMEVHERKGYALSNETQIKNEVVEDNGMGIPRSNLLEIGATNHSKELEIEIIKPITIYCCSKCPFTSRKKNSLGNHIKTHISLVYKCPLCEFSSQFTQRFRLHLNQHSNALSFFSCTLCDFKAVHPKIFISHLKIHYYENVSDLNSKLYTVVYQCSGEPCSFRAKSELEIRQHHEKCAHVNVNQMLHSSEMGITMPSSSTFSTNNLSGSNTFMVERMNNDTEIDRSFIDDYSEIENKSNNDQISESQSCGKSSANLLLLDGTFERSFSCPDCPYKPKNGACLRLHLKVHSDKNLLQCKHCSYKCKRKENLLQHMWVHWEPKEAKTFNCNLCSYGFKRVHALRTHMLLSHQTTYLSKNSAINGSSIVLEGQQKSKALASKGFEPQPIFCCSKCEFSSRKKCAMGNHIKKHLSVVYSCPICDFSSKVIQRFCLHLRRHSKSSTFSCLLCDFKTSNSGSFVSHLKYHNSFDVLHNKRNPHLKLYNIEFQCTGDSCIFLAKSKSEMHKHYKKCEFFKATNLIDPETRKNTTSTVSQKCFSETSRTLTESSKTDAAGDWYIADDTLKIKKIENSNESLIDRESCSRLSNEVNEVTFCETLPVPVDSDTNPLHQLPSPNNFVINDNLSEKLKRNKFLANLKFRSNDQRGRMKPVQLTTEPVLYECSRCEYSSTNKSNLRNHMFIHSDERLFSCQYCPYKGKQSAGLRAHLKVHSMGKPYHCTKCPYKSKRKQNLRQHLITHSKLRPFKCSTCSFRSISKQFLKKHHCKYQTTSLVDATFTRNAVSEFNIKLELCTNENEKSEVIANDNIEELLVVDGISEPGYELLDQLKPSDKDKKDIVSSHIEKYDLKPIFNKMIHTSSMQQLQNESNQLVRSVSRLTKAKLYKPKKRLSNKGNFKCSVCEFKTNNNYHFKSHQLTHSYASLNCCPYCPYKSKWKQSLNKHVRNHLVVNDTKLKSENSEHHLLESVGSDPLYIKLASSESLVETLKSPNDLVCPLCGFRCSRREQMVCHFQIHSGENVTNRVSENTVEDKIFYCPNCDFSSKRRAALGNHVKIHNQHKNLFCPLCSFKCKLTNAFRKHLHSHELSNLLRCSYCDFESSNIDSFVYHMEKHLQDHKIDNVHGFVPKSTAHSLTLSSLADCVRGESRNDLSSSFSARSSSVNVGISNSFDDSDIHTNDSIDKYNIAEKVSANNSDFINNRNLENETEVLATLIDNK